MITFLATNEKKCKERKVLRIAACSSGNSTILRRGLVATTRGSAWCIVMNSQRMFLPLNCSFTIVALFENFELSISVSLGKRAAER